MNKEILYTNATSQSDLHGILELQQANLPKNISTLESKREGFVTVEHDLEILTRMNRPHPHSIAKVDEVVVGYTLTMEKELRYEIEVLVPMFDQIDKIKYQGVSLKNASYITMGQVCIAKHFRGIGVFQGLYHHMQGYMKDHFDFIITEISSSNPRSLKAHAKVGFENILSYSTNDGHHWVIALLPLRG